MFNSFTHKKIFYLNLIFWIGLTSLVYEIYSTKVLFLFFMETSHAVTIAISAFLAGLAFSSLLFSSLARNSTKNNLLIIFWMQIAVIVYGYFILKQYYLIPQVIDFLRANVESVGFANFLKIIIIWIYLFIPAFFIGGSFPLVNGLYLESVEKGTRDTGLVYFWDTFGSILGAFLAGFLLLPQLGFRLTCVVAIFINLLIALSIAPKKKWYIFILLFGLLILINEYFFYQKNKINIIPDDSTPLVHALQPQENLSSSFLTDKPTNKNLMASAAIPEYPELDKIFGNILFQENSPFGKITIGNNAREQDGNKVLFVNYRDMCHSQSHSSESKIGVLATSNLPENSRVLNIGLGCGFTAGAINQQKTVTKLDVAEINAVVAKGTSQFFTKENGDVLNSPKTTLLIEDGAEFIRNTQNKYNAIVIDIEEVSVIYSSPLYTKEYFTIAKNKMSDDGILALWAQRGGEEFEKIIYNTLRSVFENVEIIMIDGFYTFYASSSSTRMPDPALAGRTTSLAKQEVKKVLDNPINLINTLDNQILEKYFDVRAYFNLPIDYEEEFIK